MRSPAGNVPSTERSIEPRRPAAKIDTNVDERDADHERRGGHRGAAGVAQRVLARQAPGDARRPPERPPDERRERAHEPRAEHRDAEEDERRAPRPMSPAADRRTRRRTARRAAARRPATPSSTAMIVRTRPPPRCSTSALAQRATGGDPRGAQRGREARDDGHDGADEQRDDDRPRLDDRPGVGRSAPTALNRACRPWRDEQAAQQADHRRAEADHERLEDDRAEHLPRAGAERAQQRELARALRDGDRERVVDDERADEERDAGEDEQAGLQEAESWSWMSFACRSASSLPVRTATASPRSASATRVLSSLGLDAGVGGDGDLVELAPGSRPSAAPRAAS